MAVHPSADLADGTYVLSVKVTDKAGNHATSETLAVTIDGVASASITVDVIAGDDIVNAQDAQGTVTITGTVGGDATEGDTVTLTLQAEGQDATTYIGTVKADGTYSINVPGGALATDADRTIVASVSGTDAAGNAFTATTEVSGDNKDGGYKVDTEISKPTIDLLASSDSGKDDTLGSDTDNLTNDKTPTFELGNIDNDVVTVEVFNGETKLGNATQAQDGTWQFTPSADLADGTYVLSVKVTDKAGNHATSETLAVTIDGVASASITVDVIAGDDIVNAQDAQGTVTITGTVGGDATEGDTVTLTLQAEGQDATTYIGTVKADGTYSINVPGGALATDADRTIVASVSGTDAAGNAFTATTEVSGDNKDGGYKVDTEISKPTIDLLASSDSGKDDTLGSDTDNLTNDKTPTFELGNIDNDVVTVEVFNGETKLGNATQAQDGTWQFTPSADLADGTYVLSVKVTDKAGNHATSETLAVTIDGVASASITVDVIAGDDIVNAQDAQGTVTITGTVGGDATEGDTVTLTLQAEGQDATTYIGTVKADGTYSINVPGGALATDADRTIVASVSGTDAAGNAFTATTEVSGDNKDGGYKVDTEISKPTIDLLASSDSGKDDTLGSDTDNLTNDKTPTFELGNIDNDVVTVEVFNGETKLGNATQAQDGTWQFTPSADLADGTYVLSVKVTDKAGNHATSETLAVTIDGVASASITVDVIAGDDIVNAQDAQGTVTITGTVGGDATEGDTVTLTLQAEGQDATTYIGTVKADGTYSINVPGGALATDADRTIVASVSGTDAAGNAFTATTEVSGDNKDGGYKVDTEISKPTIDLLASSDSGKDDTLGSDTDNLTNDKTPTFELGNIDNDVVTVEVFNGETKLGNATQAQDGTWQFTPSADLADGTYVLSVKVTDKAGNHATSETLAVTIDGVASASITVDVIAGDDIVNAQDAQGTVTITGTVGGDATEGDTVTLTLQAEGQDATTYIGTVKADGTYSINVPGGALATDADRTIVASVSGTDAAGNAFTATTEVSGDNKDGGYKVDTEISKPTIDLLASSDSGKDDTLGSDTDNLTNDKTPTFELGNIDNDVVTVEVFNGETKLGNATQAQDGTWQFTPSADLADGTYVLSVKVTDKAGNHATSETLAVTIDGVASASITVDVIAGDDIVNAQDAQGTVTITGTVGGDATEGDTVTLTLQAEGQDATTYIGTVKADGTYSINVPGGALATDADRTIVASVSGTDAAGNAFTATTEVSGDNKDGGYKVDTEISKPTIDLLASSDSGKDDTLGSDTDNLTNDKTPTFELGNIDNDVVTVEVFNGETKLGNATQAQDGTWQFTPSADLADGTYVLSVKVTDKAGNHATSETLAVTIDGVASASITVDVIAGDDIVNAQDAQGTVTITGTVGGDATEGDTVTLTLQAEGQDATTYIGTVKADGTYSINVPGGALATDADRTIVASVSGTDAAGNAFTATTEVSGDNKDGGYKVDTEISKPTIDLLASSDSGKDDTLGSDTDNLTNDKTPTFELGNIDNDVVTVEVFNGETKLGNATQAQDGTWQFTPSADLADGTYVLSVKVTDKAGNHATSETLAVTIDGVASASITVDVIAGDDIVNAQDAQGTVTITGTVGGDATEGDTVTLTLQAEGQDATTYIGTVKADGTYSINVPGGALATDADRTIVASVSGTDAAGNAFTATTEVSGDNKDGGYKVDTEISKPTIDLLASSDSGKDDTLGSDTDNLTNDKTPTFELGNIDNDVVTVEVFNGETKLGNATQAQDGTWQFTPSADLADGTYVLSVKVTDKAGNHATSETLAVTIDGVASASITVDVIAGDDIVNAQDAQGTVTITGTVGGDATEGDTVTLTLQAEGQDATTYIGTVKADGTYSINVPGGALATDADRTIVASVSGTDAAGNAFTATTEVSGDNKDGGYKVDTEISKPTIDLLASSDSGKDDTLGSDTDNLTNDKTPTFELGNIDNDVVTVEVFNGETKLGNATQAQDGTWQFTPSADLADGTYVLSVKVTDKAGNHATSETLAVTIDGVASASITVDVIAGDDIVNAQDAQGTVTITGTVGGDATEGDTVTLTLQAEGQDATTYIGTVKADGTYSINVPGGALATDADRTIVASVSGTDAAGNAFTATTEVSGDNKDGGYKVDTEISKPTIDLLASSDSGKDDTLGSDTDNLTNDKTPTFELGNIDNDVVTVEVFNGETKLGNATQAQDGTWQFTRAPTWRMALTC